MLLHDFQPTQDFARRKIRDILEYVTQHEKFSRILAGDAPSLKLRFACDGAKISKMINSVRAVFKILHPRMTLPTNIEELSMSPEDKYTAFFFIGDEKRKTIADFGRKTFAEMEELSREGIEINGKKINIEWVLTCDWKAMALRGINPANANYFCLWCHCTKEQICDFSVPTWPIHRSSDEQRGALRDKKLGYREEDLCSFIDYSAMPVDDLHLRIRISTELFNQVVTWAIDQKRDQDLQQEMARIGVSFQVWEEQGTGNNSSTKVKKWSQPSGDDLRTVVKNLQIHNILENRADRRLVSPESLTVSQLKEELADRGLPIKGTKCQLVARLTESIGNGTKILQKNKKSRLRVSYQFDESDGDDGDLNTEAIQSLWEQFHELMESLRVLPSSAKYKNGETFRNEAREWATKFRKFTFDEDVIPYIHAMVYHVPQFLDRYRYLHDIGVAQVERKNFDHRQAYFGSTNRNGGRGKHKISKQILERENRLLWARLEGIERKKRAYKKKD